MVLGEKQSVHGGSPTKTAWGPSQPEAYLHLTLWGPIMMWIENGKHRLETQHNVTM